MHGELGAWQCKPRPTRLSRASPGSRCRPAGPAPLIRPRRAACRARIWGSAGMPRALMADKDCWLQLMALDPVTGVDPEGTRLRAHEGLDGVDFFVPVC